MKYLCKYVGTYVLTYVYIIMELCEELKSLHTSGVHPCTTCIPPLPSLTSSAFPPVQLFESIIHPSLLDWGKG